MYTHTRTYTHTHIYICIYTYIFCIYIYIHNVRLVRHHDIFQCFSAPLAFFPTCQVRVTRFYQSDAGRGLILLLFLPPPPRRTPRASSSPAADRSGNCRTSSASSRSQWALPDLNCEFQIPVGNAGPQPRVHDLSGQRLTSTASSDRISDRMPDRTPD